LLIEIEVKLGNSESFREQALPLPFARWFNSSGSYSYPSRPSCNNWSWTIWSMRSLVEEERGRALNLSDAREEFSEQVRHRAQRRTFPSDECVSFL